MDDRYRSRKWRLAVGLSVGVHIALFAGFIEGDHYVILVGGILGLYQYANVTEKKGNA